MIVEVHVNCPSAVVADRIAAAVLAKRLAAAANRHPEIVSRYRWKGAPCEAAETPLVLKTRKELFEALAEEIRRVHPYETPGVVAVELVAATPDYAAWIIAETDAPSGDRA